MKPAFAIPELYDMTENINHQRTLFLFFLDLFHDKGGQLLLFCIKHNGVNYPSMNDERTNGAR